MKAIITDKIVGASGSYNRFIVAPGVNQAGEFAGVAVQVLQYGDIRDLTARNLVKVLREQLELRIVDSRNLIAHLDYIHGGPRPERLDPLVDTVVNFNREVPQYNSEGKLIGTEDLSSEQSDDTAKAKHRFTEKLKDYLVVADQDIEAIPKYIYLLNHGVELSCHFDQTVAKFLEQNNSQEERKVIVFSQRLSDELQEAYFQENPHLLAAYFVEHPELRDEFYQNNPHLSPPTATGTDSGADTLTNTQVEVLRITDSTPTPTTTQE